MQRFYEQYVTFDPSKTSGSQLYAICPLHDDTNASFTVNVDTGAWYCHGCGFGGHIVEFIEHYYDVGRQVATFAENYWQKKGKMPFPTMEQVEKAQAELKKRPSQLQELLDFGITEDFIDKMQWGWDDIRVIIPVYSRTGALVNLRKYLPPSRRIEGSTNVKVCGVRGLNECRFYPYEAFNDLEEIYIVEGEKDCAVARSQGLNAVTGTGGSNIPNEECALFSGKVVYLMTDSDPSGVRTAKKYYQQLKSIAKEIKWVTLPVKDFTDYWVTYKTTDVSEYVVPIEKLGVGNIDKTEESTSLVQSEFVENLNTWVRIENMSVTGVDPKTYTVPCKLRVMCRDSKCTKPCNIGSQRAPEIIDVDPRQLVQFVDSGDNVQDTYLRKIFGCKSVVAEPAEYVNIQKFLFQQSASFVDGLEDATFEHRYGIYEYQESRLTPTVKYDFEACRVTDPRTQQNFYVVRSAALAGSELEMLNTSNDTILRFKSIADSCTSAFDLINKHYDAWHGALGIDGRPDLFGAILLTFCSVTEIKWKQGLLKGWLDTMVIGDTRTGKSQMAQRFVKTLNMGSYINGENARRTGVIGGVQKFGDSWVITWGAIPMNDKGLLIIDESSGLSVEDIKELSATRSSGAVTINKIAKGEARARTRLIWLSNPRSGRNLEDFYWKGFGAFQEFIPVAEDQARYDLVLSAAREDVDVLEYEDDKEWPELTENDLKQYRELIKFAWTVNAEDITIPKETVATVRQVVKDLEEEYGGGPLVVGVAVHEKLLRLSTAFAILCGSIDINSKRVIVESKHVLFAKEFIQFTFVKDSFDYAGYIKEYKRVRKDKEENTTFIRTQVAMYPALKVLLSSNQFRGMQVQEILGIDKLEASKIISELLRRGLCRVTSSGAYAPDKLLIEITKQMEVGT